MTGSVLLLHHTVAAPALASLERDLPAFSRSAGFYTDSFPLELKVPRADGEIRYTTDGSYPRINSLLYSEPILISDRTQGPSTFARFGTVAEYRGPLRSSFKGTVLRAQLFHEGKAVSAVATHTFFVHPSGRARYTLPVVCLSTAPDNFFDGTGIYVQGNAPGGNYAQRGDAWTRPVFVEFIETNGIVTMAQAATVKIHGNSSRQFVIKGLDLKAEGNAAFDYRIFPDRTRASFRHFLLRPSGHDHGLAFMRDELMQSLAAEFGAETQAARLAVVFINGEYWGLHYLKEKEDEDFIAYYGKVQPGQFDYLEDYVVARAGDDKAYQELLQFIRRNSLREAANYEHILALMDMPNYIDYKVAEIFSYRWDIGNHRLWRPRVPGGRFRWLQFDNDVGWGGFWAQQPPWSFDMLEAASSSTGSLYGHNDATRTYLLRRLLDNGLFVTNFVTRFCDLLNTVYTPKHTLRRIDEFAAALEPEMAEHTARWRTPSSLEEWRNNVQVLRDFASRRPAFARSHLSRKFGLGEVVRLSLLSTLPVEGKFAVNSVNVSVLPDQAWNGSYFAGFPLTVTAPGFSGFLFAGWKGSFKSATNRLQIVPKGDLTLEAVYKPLSTAGASPSK